MNSSDDLTASGQSPSATSKGIVLLTAIITYFFFGYTFSSVNIALPAIGREFNADAIMLGWIPTAATLSSAVLLIPVGKISDIIGIKKVFTYGMILYTLAAVAATLSISIPMLIVIRVIQGVSAAMVVGNTTALISVLFPVSDRGRALGITSAAVYTGVAVSPFLGGVLTEHFGWRSIFLLTIPAGLFITLLILWKIKGEWRGAKGEHLDLVGSTIFGVAVIALMYGFSVLPDKQGLVLIPVGILGFLGFLKWEERATSPILNIDIFKSNRIFIFSSISAFINYAATFAVVFLLSLYLQYVKGFSAETAGIIMMAQPIIQACLSPLAGRLSDKIEARVVSSIGMAICCLSLALLSFLTADTPIPLIIFALMLLGIGLAVFVTPNTNAGMSAVEPRIYGVASAILSTVRQVGQLFSMGITMIVLAIFMGRVAITPESYPAFVTTTRISFALFAVLCLVGVFTSLARGNIHAD